MPFRRVCAPGLVMVLLVADLGGAGSDARLADAVQSRNTPEVRSLLTQRFDVNAPQGDGATALHWAAHWGDVETAEMLIRAGAAVNARNDYGITPLSLAAANRSAAIIEQLLTAGADPNGAVREGETPLMMSARTGHVDALQLLINYGADVNAKETWNGQTALMWAAAEGHARVSRLLIDHRADLQARSNSGATALLFAARRGDLDVVRMLLAAGANVNVARPDAATPLLVAIVNGHEDLVDLLLAQGADPNTEGGATEVTRPGTRSRALELAFKPIIEDGPDNENQRRGNIWGTPLHAAVHMGNPEKGDVHFAVKLDRVRVIKALLAHGANVNARIRTVEPRWIGARYRRQLSGATPFLLAAKAADLELMRLFLAEGADPTMTTNSGITPLMAAAGIAWSAFQDRASESQVLEAVKLLVEELGAEVNAENDYHETPMHAAAYRGANTVLQYLFDKGAKLDVVAVDGRTPLIVADGVEYGNGFAAHPETAALLRKLGANERQCPPPCSAEVKPAVPR